MHRRNKAAKLLSASEKNATILVKRNILLAEGGSGKVISMAEQMYIKQMYEDGVSKSEIQRRTKLNYRTVCKYADKEDWNEEKQLNLASENYPVPGRFIPLVNEWLEGDTKVPRKQRHTAKRIYDRLREEAGFSGSYSSVKRYVKKKRIVMRQGMAGCLPLAHPMGYAQLDFGEFRYSDTAGTEHKAYELVMSFPYSDKAYAQVFPSQNQECLLVGMRRIFEYIGGVPARIRFDNMSTAVSKILEGTERKLTDGFTRFMLHYHFAADFCNPASGNEKGNVENKVGYIRRNALVPIPTIKSFDEFNKYLFEWCEKDAERVHYQRGVTIQSLWEEERGKLKILPQVPYEVFRYEAFRVSKTGFVSIDTNKYGLSPELHDETVQAKIFYDKIEFYHDKALVASYRRSYEKNEELMDWTQYVTTMRKKPGAAEYTKFFTAIPQPWQDYLTQTKGRERRNALQLLEDIVRDGNADCCEDILTLSQQSGKSDVESVKQCYYSLLKEDKTPEPLKLLSPMPMFNYAPDLSVYDGLIGGEGNG